MAVGSAVGAAEATRIAEEAGTWTVENDLLEVTVDPKRCCFDVLDKRVGYTWRQHADPWYAGVAKQVRVDDGKLRMTFDHLRAGPAGKAAIQLEMTVELGGPDLTVTLHAPPETRIGQLRLPFPFLIDTSGGAIVAAHKQGIL